MISNLQEFQKAQEELKVLEQRLERLQREHPVGSKGYTKAGVHKMIARLHDELAIYEGSRSNSPAQFAVTQTTRRIWRRGGRIKNQ